MLGRLVNHHSSKLCDHPKCLSCVLDIFLTGKLTEKILLFWLKDIKILKDTLKDNVYLFPFLICLLNVCLLKDRLPFSKFEKASLTVWSLTYAGRSNAAIIGSFPFARGPFLETENYLLVSKTAANLCNLQFLPRPFSFKNQNELLGIFLQMAYFCDTLSF